MQRWRKTNTLNLLKQNIYYHYINKLKKSTENAFRRNSSSVYKLILWYFLCTKLERM